MGAVFCFLLFLAAVGLCILWGQSLILAIWVGIAAFAALGLRRGMTVRAMWDAAWEQGRKMCCVIVIYMLIGAITALWRSAGTIAFFIYHGLRIITPQLFLLVTFLLTSFISYALGTSFGVVGTLGVILMALARSGGVSVAIGELADGLRIDLDAVRKKYDGLDGTELAISESQERMAVVVAAGDADAFIRAAKAENLEAYQVAVVTEDARMVMEWNGAVIADLSRAFLNTNGAVKHAGVRVARKDRAPLAQPRFSSLREMASSLRCASRRGLVERFDSTIGAGSILMPYGGRTQRSPAQAMAAVFPVLPGQETDQASVMAWGCDPEQTCTDPYTGAYNAVYTSMAKLVAAEYPEVIYLPRGAELGGDRVPKVEVYKDSFARMETRTGKQYDAMIDLDITSPLRTEQDIENAFAKAQEREDLQIIFSVCEARRNPWFNMFKIVGDHAEMVIESQFTGRQQAPEVYDVNASIYVIRRAFLVDNPDPILWHSKFGVSVMMDTGIIDIDSEHDYLLMEAIAQHLYAHYPEFNAVRENIRG